jgi:hypothetical protein
MIAIQKNKSNTDTYILSGQKRTYGSNIDKTITEDELLMEIKDIVRTMYIKKQHQNKGSIFFRNSGLFP